MAPVLYAPDNAMGYRFASNSRRSQDSLFAQWYGWIAIASFVGILLYTLFPYDFSLIRNFSLSASLRQFSADQLTSLKDFLEMGITLLLFVPLSFGVTGIGRQWGGGKVATLGISVLLCCSLALLTELLHSILPGRHSNFFDLVGAGLGGLVGWALFYQWRLPLLTALFEGSRAVQRTLSPRRLISASVGYFLLATILLVLLPTATDFRNWNLDFPLVLGNEAGGGRPWQGAIARLQIYQRALSEAAIAQLLATSTGAANASAIAPEDLLVSYAFTQAPYRDQTGRLPDLTWNAAPAIAQDAAGVRLSAEHWLSVSSARELNRLLQQSSQFTLDLIATPANLQQRGPARIVSLSRDSRNRNLTVGQAGRDLVIRLRTPITGNNGANPPVVVPQVFADTQPRHLVITYADSMLRVYGERMQRIYATQLPHYGYRLVYYGMVFVPLGVLVGAWAIARSDRMTQILLVLGLLATASVVLEWVLVLSDRRPVAPLNLGLSFGLGLLTVWVAHRPLQRWFSR